MLLDIFDDVSSWRRMTAADLHLPFDTTEALIKASYSSVVGLQGDNVQEVLDNTMLNELIRSHARLFQCISLIVDINCSALSNPSVTCVRSVKISVVKNLHRKLMCHF